MLESYLAKGMDDLAVFEFFVRKLPVSRSFLMAAGLEQAISYLLNARCAPDELDWLKQSGKFSHGLIDYLAAFKFTGNVDALAEGTIVFADEPLLRVTAPLLQAQLVESRLINILQYQTLVATKAARMVLAAPGKGLFDFGFRRAHSGEAGVLAARASYIAGFKGTATLSAGMMFGLPTVGTMAHSYVQAHQSEEDAFLSFAEAHPSKAILLIDTYNTEKAARKIPALASKLAARGISILGVRIDSGDLAVQAKNVRSILDRAGLSQVTIIGSGGIDEFVLQDLEAAKAPIDSYGIGTSLVASDDAPALDCAYKLKSYAGQAKRKLSEGKSYWPGPTQVFREVTVDGRMHKDTIACDYESLPGAPLLKPIVTVGKLPEPLPTLDEIREFAKIQLEGLPDSLRHADEPSPYVVSVSPALRRLAEVVDRRNMA
jgi:nicotinate phosphoribosyltransferase